MGSSSKHRSPASAERARLWWTTLISIGVHGALFGVFAARPPPEIDPAAQPRPPPIEIRVIARQAAPPPEPSAVVERGSAVPHESTLQRKPTESRPRRKPRSDPKERVEDAVAHAPAMDEGTPIDRHPGSVLRPRTSAEGSVRLELPRLPSGVSSKSSAPSRTEPSAGGVDPKTQKEIFARLRPMEGGGYSYRDTMFSAEIRPDGTVLFEDDKSIHMIHPLAYAVDITDVIMRAHGEDPYLDEKRKLMHATADLRAEMYKQECKVRLDRSVFEIEDRLLSIWHSASPVEDRRRLIFELWDDCAEDGDEATLRAAEMIRVTIIAFVRKHLGPGSPLAYSNREIEALNRRRSSKTRFSPYLGDAGVEDAGSSHSAL